MLEDNLMKFSFIICTNLSISAKMRLQEIIKSIQDQKIPDDHYEIIIIGGKGTFNTNCLNAYHIEFDEDIRKGWITKKKNIAAKSAQYENLVIMHDYFVLDDDWYRQFTLFGNDWDIAMNARIMMDGRRQCTDWAIYKHPKYYNVIGIPYWAKSKYQYVDASYFVVKRKWFLNDRMYDENLVWGDAEDIEWSKRVLNDSVSLVMNEKSIVRHNKIHDNCGRLSYKMDEWYGD
tara:strand:+ start:36838 stop:37533 length:696 start_codon:yes stop_codon:yes gene_type:complete